MLILPTQEDIDDMVNTGRCQHCSDRLHPDELTKHESSGCTLCPECLDYYKDNDEIAAREEREAMIEALAKVSADKADTLRFMAANTYESFDDKSNLDNIKFWADVANRSLATR